RQGSPGTKRGGNAGGRRRGPRRRREVVRQVGRELPLCGVDLVVIGRSATINRKFSSLLADYRKALKKAGVVGDA
ncbi:MAG: ribonuclease P protein component, partial [Novacetimonas hansenii]